MLRNFYVIVLLLSSFPLVAQKTVLASPMDLAVTAKTSTCESFILPDERTAKTTIVLKGSDKVEYLLVNKNFEIESKVQPKNGLVNTIFGKEYEKYLAGVTNNLGVCFYYMIDRNHFYMEIVDFANGSIINKSLFDKPDDEKNIEWFTCQDRFYLLAVNEKKGELVLYVVDENGMVSHKNISVDLNGYNPDKLTVREYFSYSHVFYPKQETELIEATELTKIYPYPGRIIMIVGNFKEPPHVWTIDMQTYNVTKRKMDFSDFSGFGDKKGKFFNNTYLYGDNLFVVNSSKQKIEIGVLDFNTGKLLRKHEIDETSKIQFVETPIEITTKGRFTKKNVINSNRELIKELFKGSNGIAVARNANGEIILTCGVYDKGVGVSGDPEVVRQSFFAGMHSADPLVRSYSNSFYLGSHREKFYSYTRTVNFKILLDSSEFKLVASNGKLSTIEKINNCLKSLPGEIQAINTFRISNKYYLSYYSPTERTFFVKEMEK